MTTSIAQAVRSRLQVIEAQTPRPQQPPRRLFYLIEVTEVCAVACPVCYAAVLPGRGRHQSVEQVLRSGRRVRKDGGRFVELIGGEPAEHPAILEIVRGLRQMGLRPVLTTNGLRLGGDPAFASALKRAGLHKVSLQFDTLTAATSVAMRGRDYTAQKKAAVTHGAAAGMHVGLIATMCDRNVSDAGPILQFALSHAPHVNSVTFQCLIPVGRYPEKLRPVGREEILCSLLSSPAAEQVDLRVDDILPPPQYAPWRALTHPACSSLLFLCPDSRQQSARPLGRDVELEQFYRRLHAADGRDDGLVSSVGRPLAALWRSTRPGRRLAVWRRAFNLARGRGDGFFTVTVDGDRHDQPWSAERVARCPACFVTEEGFVSTGSKLCAAAVLRANGEGGT